MNVEGETPSAGEPSNEEADFSSMVADVFGLDLGGEPVTPPSPAQPSVGTEGVGAGEGVVTPSSAPAPASPTPPPSEGQGSAPAAQPGVAPTPPQGQPPAQAPTPPALPPETQLEMTSLRNQVAEMTARLAELTASQAPQQGGQQPPAGGQPGGRPQVQPINVQLPPQMLEEIFHEEPARAAAGLNALVSTIATGLSVRFEGRLAQVQQQFSETLRGQQQQTEEAVAQEQAQHHRAVYFERFPVHNKPVYQPIIAQEAAALVAANPGAVWDDAFMAALGARVNNKLIEMGVQLAPGNPPPPPPNPNPAPPTPAAFLPSGSRPAPEEDINIIAETLEWG